MTTALSFALAPVCKCRAQRLNRRCAFASMPLHNFSARRFERANRLCLRISFCGFHSTPDEKNFTRPDSRRKIVGIGG
jgi:hypothetical protein